MEQTPSPDDLSAQIAALVRTLHETEQRLQELTHGQMDTVVLPTGQTYLLGKAQEKLRQSEEKFHQLAENITDVFWIRSPDLRELYYVSPSFERIWGRSVESLNADPSEWISFIVPEDRERVQAAFTALTGDAPSLDIEYRIIRPDGEIRWVHVRGFKVRDAAGKVIRLTGIVTDITERRRTELELSRTNRALKMLSSGNEKLIRAESEQELLVEICQMAVDIGGYRMAWVGYAQDDEDRTIKPIAHAGEENGYLAEIKLSWSDEQPSGRGPAGQTIRSGQPVVCEDLMDGSMSFHWRAPAQQRGYQGVICLPLREGNRTFGLLALYSAEVSQMEAGEIKLLQELADDLAFGISHLRSESEKRRIQTAVLKVATGVSTSTGTEFFQQLARSMADALDAKVGIVSQMHPGEPAMGRTIAAVVDGQVVDNFSYEINTTPCQNLMTADECIIAEKVAECFPRATMLAALGVQAYVGRRLANSNGQTIGQLFVLFAEPLKQTDFITATLQIFAARAASELERQQADAQVREQAALLDAASDAIVLKDMDDVILFWNRGAEKIFGWTAAEAIGKKLRDLLSAEPAKFDEGLQALRHKDHWLGEIKSRTKDGQELVIEVRWTLVRDTAGKPKSVLAINTDITERKKLEAQFLRIQRMESIGTLAGGVAHDLNNILAPITMSIQLLHEKVNDEEGHALLDALQTSSQRGAELVKQVLSFARGVEGQRTLINIAHLIREIQKIIRETFPKNIEFRFHPGRDVWMVTGDPTQFHQVFMNLCVNARDAMPDGGKLTVTIENVTLDEAGAGMNPGSKPGAYVVAKVSDTGTGMTPDIRDKIFEPFFTTKGIGKGTGLGLSTSQAIIKSHDGFINVYSKPGKGSVFKVYLPAEIIAQATEKVPVEHSRLPRGNGELVLVVDDEEGIRLAARKTLERFGYRVLLATNGAEAVSLYARRGDEIAVVLTDMAMPVMDGPSTIIALKVMNPKVKVIGSSGHTSNEGMAKAVGSGVKHFIPKPYTAELMLKTFAQALQSSPPA